MGYKCSRHNNKTVAAANQSNHSGYNGSVSWTQLRRNLMPVGMYYNGISCTLSQLIKFRCNCFHIAIIFDCDWVLYEYEPYMVCLVRLIILKLDLHTLLTLFLPQWGMKALIIGVSSVWVDGVHTLLRQQVTGQTSPLCLRVDSWLKSDQSFRL